jgi:hypothetical protein
MIALAFLAEYERVRDLLVANQRRGARGEHGLRLYHFDRFPYTVVYEGDAARGPKSSPSRIRAANRDIGAIESKSRGRRMRRKINGQVSICFQPSLSEWLCRWLPMAPERIRPASIRAAAKRSWCSVEAAQTILRPLLLAR